MKLKIDYESDTTHYELAAIVDANAELDAEGMGYASMVLFKAAEYLAAYAKSMHPDLHGRVQKGIQLAVSELENNEAWPFDRTITRT
jgi:hypothetical protein